MSGNDAKYFSRGKVQEFQDELKDVKKDSSKSYKETKKILKKVIANITMGNDISALANEMIGLLSIQDPEVKKMVYLFIVSYAAVKPEIAEAAIPAFTTDTRDENPLIRVLAIRNMSNIPVEKVWLAACEPIRRALADKDPYVCKTAAISVAKIFSYSPEVVKTEGLLERLTTLLNHGNANVVANTVLSLMDIASNSNSFAFALDVPTANKLLSALDESTEWSQGYLMESLMTVFPDDPMEAGLLADRIAPRLQHANSGIVLSAVRIIVHLSSFLEKADQITGLIKKCGPPLVTLLHGPVEIQYVALKNIQLLLQKHKDFLKSEVKVFFCKYNDPIYVKLAKLDIMFQLADDSNVFSLLPELKEYSQEVDVDFVRKAVRSIGRCAVKIESSADKCVETLVDLIETKVDYVVQEAIVVIKDIFRKYPNRFESIIRILCENLSSLEEPEAKSSMIWIIGQYSDRINNADQLLSGFLDGFRDESSIVQLSLLTAIVKLFIKRPALGQTLVPKVLKYSTEEVDNPDLRDRGFMYWRLLSTNPVAAKTIVFGDKPSINTESDNFDPSLLSRLLHNVSTLSSLSHRPTIISQELANKLLRNFNNSKKILDEARALNEKLSKSAASPTIPPASPTSTSPMNYLPQQPEPKQTAFASAPAVKQQAPQPHLINGLDQLSLLDGITSQPQQKSQPTYSGGLPLDLFSGPAAPIPSNRSPSPDLYGMPMNAGNTMNSGGNNLMNSGGMMMGGGGMQIPPQNNMYGNQQQTAPIPASNHNPFAAPVPAVQQLYQQPTMSPTPAMNQSPSNPFASQSMMQQQTINQPYPTGGAVQSGSGNLLQLDSNSNAVLDPFARTSSNNNKSPSPTNLNMGSSSPTGSPAVSPFAAYPVLLTAQLGRGLEIKGAFAKRNGAVFLDMQFINKGGEPLKDFAIMFNKNSFGLTPALPLSVQPLFPNQSTDTSLPIKADAQPALSTPPNNIQVALKNQVGVCYFQLLIPLHLLFKEGGGLAQQPWLSLWKGELSSQEYRSTCIVAIPLASVSAKLQSSNFSIVAERQIENRNVFFGSCAILDGTVFLAEINIDPSTMSCVITTKSYSAVLSPVFNESVASLLSSMPLYPEIEPFNTFRIQVNPTHSLYVEESGLKTGKPVLFVHGGPGGGTSGLDRRYFNPSKYRIILFDQRGSGKSTPHAELEGNDTFALVEDIEKIRIHLNIEKWLVFGGSWGSTLSLTYAISHPDRVKALILRGIFMLRRSELLWFYQDGASHIFADYFKEYKEHIPVAEQNDIITAYYKRLTSPDATVRLEAAKKWSRWEMATSKLEINHKMLSKADEDEFALAFARIECHYFVNKGFFSSDEWILENLEKIKHLPISITQGRYDVVCPMKSAHDLHAGLLKVGAEKVELTYTLAGHSATEKETTESLVKAADSFSDL